MEKSQNVGIKSAFTLSKNSKFWVCEWRVKFGFKCKFQNPLSSFSPFSLLSLSLSLLFCFRLCLVWVKIGRMENRGRKIGWKTLFSTVWLEKENWEDRKLGRNFSLPGPYFLSSPIGRKSWREKCCHSTFTQIPRFSLLSQLQTQQSFFQTSLNSSIIRLSEYKLKNTILKLIKS